MEKLPPYKIMQKGVLGIIFTLFLGFQKFTVSLGFTYLCVYLRVHTMAHNHIYSEYLRMHPFTVSLDTTNT